MGWSFDAQVAAARKEMQEKRAEMEREKVVKGLSEPAPARRAPARSEPSAPAFGTRVICQETIGTRSVSIYNNGYVKVSRFGGEQIEKLISIEYSANVQKKSAAGRGAAAVLTLGLNLIGSKQRGDVYLTIVTDRQTYTLHVDPPRASVISAAQELAVAGQSVLAQLAAERAAQLQAGAASASASTPSPTKPKSVTDRLKELSKLHEQGMVSDDEFKEFRQNLLKEL